jgi:hypothetical protein
MKSLFKSRRILNLSTNESWRRSMTKLWWSWRDSNWNISKN